MVFLEMEWGSNHQLRAAEEDRKDTYHLVEHHRCAIPARINQYQYLILKNQVSIPISISIFQISEIDTDFNTNTPDLENQYRYQYQYLSFENSITIPIPILKILSFNINLDLNTKVLQYSEWKNFQLPAVNWKCHVAKLIQTKQFGVY